MNSTISAPPHVSDTSPEPVRAAADASWLSRLSPRGFRLLLLGIFAIAATLASEGMQRLAALRANYYLATDRGGAVSPLPYGVPLPALAAAAGAPGGLRAVVRADSAGEGRAALCALASALGNQPGVVWLAATSGVDTCVHASAGRRVVSATPAARTELARARWVLLGGDGQVLHSGRAVPTAAEVRETAALFSPVTAPAPFR